VVLRSARPICTHQRHSRIYPCGGSGFRLDLPLETEDPRPAVSEGHAWGPQSRSRDLAACSTVGAEPVVRMFEYIVWPSAEPLGAVPATVELEITEVLPLKQRAVTEHRSQRGLVIMDDPDGFVLPANLLARASAPYEVFFQTL